MCMLPYCSSPLGLPSFICPRHPPPPRSTLTPPPPSSEHYWFLRLWQVMAECCLPWDNCLIIGAGMSAPLPPLLIYLLMWCVTCSTLKRESRGGLNNCRAVPHRLARVVSGWGWWGGGALRGQSAALRIHMWNQWNGRLISRGMRAGSTYTCSLGYSSKSMAWFYFCIDWKDCAALTVWGTRHQILLLFCVSGWCVIWLTGALYYCDWLKTNQQSLIYHRFTDEQTLS